MRSRKQQSLRIVAYVILIAFLALTVSSAFSSWTESIYFDLNPAVLLLYFGASAFAIFMVLDNHIIKSLSEKISAVVAHSFLTRIVSLILLYPGSSGDPWYHLAVSRTWYNTGMHYFSFLPPSISPLVTEAQTVIGKVYIYQRAATQHGLVVILSRMLNIDVYWIHLCLLGALWSLFIPIIAFKTSKELGATDHASLLVAALTAIAPITLAWSYIEVPNSLGYLFFAVAVYFTAKMLTSNAKRKYALLAFLTSFVSLLTHSMTGFVSFAMLFLARALMFYNSNKRTTPKRATTILFLGIAASVLLLPASAVGLQLIYPIESSLSLSKLLDMEIYPIILANYSEYTFVEGIMYGVLSFLAIIGITLKVSDSKERLLQIFLALAFVALIAQYRIFLYFVDPSPFGEIRLLVFVPLAVAPLAAITIDRLFRGLALPSIATPPKPSNPSKQTNGNRYTFRQALAIFLIVLGLSAFFVQATYLSWQWITRRGDISIVSESSMDAARLIHEEYLRTGEKYVVVSDQPSEMAGIALVGRYNPNEYYTLSIGAHQNRPLFAQALSEVSLEPMFTAAKDNNAIIAYLVVAKWSVKWYLGKTANYDTIVTSLSRSYETFAVVGDGEGEIHVFRYRVALTPTEGIGPAVRVFMDSQESYINTTYTYTTFDKVTYSLNLRNASTYQIRDWPILWSYETVQPTPAYATIDANTWINFTATSTDTLYTVSWTANQIYRNVIWKDDSFREGWFRAGAGKATYSFTTDGDAATINVQGVPRDYIIHDKQLPNLSGKLSLLARLRFDQDTICYIALWDDTIGSEQAFFSGTIKAGEDYKTIVFGLPEDATFTRIRLTIRTPDGSPKTAQFDYIMFIQT